MLSDKPGLDPSVLARWLDGVLGGAASDISVDAVAGGASNLTYRVRRGDRSFALRCATAHRNDPTANTMRREMTLLEALSGSAIPHARLIAKNEDGEVLGVPFMLSEWIDGFSPRAPLAAGFRGAASAQSLAWNLTDALATIGNEDYQKLGLHSFGKPVGFLERQVDRWLVQLERAHSRRLDGIDELCSALRDACPETQRTSLIHGDYQFINVMFAPDAPPKLVAVIDWETATIGDPLLDLGWMLAGWQEEGEPPTHASYMDWTDMPSRAAVAERYAKATGLDVSGINYYVALALFKLAAIMEGWYFQFVNGRSTLAAHGAMKEMVPDMVRRALVFVAAI